MERLIRQLKECNKRFLVIGDAMLDSYLHGSVSRISPEAPVPIFNYLKKENVLGGAANVAANLAAMGLNVSLMACVGSDDAGDTLTKLLESIAVDTNLIYKSSNRMTTLKTRVVSGSHQMIRIDNEDTSDISEDTEKALCDMLEFNIADIDIILISDYNKGLLTFSFTQKIIKMANANNKKVIVDVKEKDASKYSGAYLLKPNRNELGYMTGMAVSTRDEVLEAMKFLKSISKCKNVLTTLSGDGMMFLDENNAVYESNVEAIQVCDVVGAGDTAFSYIGLGVVEGVQQQQLLQLANAASSIKVTKFGTSVVTLDELERTYGSKPSKIQILDTLLEQLKPVSNKKIVFTNGCFDILHLGHTRYLKKAKELGDILIVAVNSDTSVKRLKGEGRPINNEDNRLAMLAELNFIDYVIKFEEDTPYELIKAINPDILVKGGDYKVEDIVGYDVVTANGGEVVTIDLVDGMSTTNIIKSIQNSEEK